MAMKRKLVRSTIQALGDDEVEVRISTAIIARDSHSLIPQGARLENYKRNPVVLWNHDVDGFPVGRSEEIRVDAEEIVSRVRFPPAGISARADECRGLVKAGFINGVSVGFDPIDGQPLDAKKARGGMRITDWELLEYSFCCIPVDTEALVIARATKGDDWKCGASRQLPVEHVTMHAQAMTAEAIFEWAGGDNFDPSRARKGFLVYNAAKPKERSSYAIPIATVMYGLMRAYTPSLLAAADALENSEIPDSVKVSARAVLDHYQEKAGMAETNDTRAKHTQILGRATNGKIMKRGLYAVAELAYMLESLGYAHACSEWEAELEGDESAVPAMIGEALTKLGEAFLAMSKEEIAELLASKGLELDDDAVVVEERAFVESGKTPAARAWRTGIALARAGKALSASNEKKLGEAEDNHTRAMKHHKALGEHQEAVTGHMDAITDKQAKAQKAHDEMGEALGDAKAEPDKAPDHVARAAKAHKTLGTALGDMSDQASAMKDTQADANDSHAATGRYVKAAQRCVRSVVEGSSTAAEDEDGDSKDLQTSSSTGESEGSKDDRSYRRRQAEALRLAAVDH